MKGTLLIKKKIKIYICFTLMIILFGCDNSPKEHKTKNENTSIGYNTIEELYQASIIAIKSKDRKQIEKFVTILLPDENTAIYMGENNCEYRGFPKILKKYPNAIDSSIAFATNKFYKFALYLEKENGNLDKLQFVGFDRKLNPEVLGGKQCKCQDILFEEPWGKLVFINSKDTIPYKVGELLKVNGKWKAFTLRLEI